MSKKDAQRVRRGFGQISGTLTFSNATEQGASFAHFFPAATSVGSGSGTVRVDDVVLPINANVVITSTVLGNLQITGFAPPTGASHVYGRHVRLWRNTGVGGVGFAQPTIGFIHNSGFSSVGNKIIVNYNPTISTQLFWQGTYNYVDLVYHKNPLSTSEDYWILI